MAVTSATTLSGGKGTTRRLKAHKKSRRGCGNCKIRKVKCDESKPMCKNCKVYGTFCNYDIRYSDLQPLDYGASDVQVLRTPLCSEKQTFLSIVNGGPSPGSPGSPFDGGYQFSLQDMETLHKFHTRTILTLGTLKAGHLALYQNAYTKLACSHPFLMHIILTLTLMHDRHLGIGSRTKQSAAIAFHCSRGAALLNSRLSGSINPSERDALWACAGLLGASTFASVEATTPEEAWPLKSERSSSDLDWLKMSESKKAIWKIADPSRPDSIFHSLLPDVMRFSSVLPCSLSESELRCLPLELVQLCGLAVDSTQALRDNPYVASASFLARAINVECTTSNVGVFFGFFGCMHPNMKQLICQRDPVALLLVAYWYVKMGQCRQWWIWRRSRLEGMAICRYLRKHYGDDENVLGALRWPESMFYLET